MGVARVLTSQGVKPTGLVGHVVAWTMPLLFRSLYGKVARMLDLQPEDDVLDVACGSGVFLQKYAAQAHRIAGLDHSEVQIRLARQRHRARIDAGTAEIVQGDSAALPWEDNSFSAVTCNCLGCFAEPLRSLKEMNRVLRPSGRVVLSVDFYPDDETAQKAGQKWGLPTWTAAGLRKLMDDAGLSQISVARDKAVVFAKAIRE